MPSEQCQKEMVTYLDAPRRQPIKGGEGSAPIKTALEMGEVNDSFRVYVRCRPMLKREADSSSCVRVEDVTDFPRNPPPQRIKIESQTAGEDISKHHAQRGEFVFDRVFQFGSGEGF